MIAVTYLPLFITILLRGMPGLWQHRHRLVLCWLIVMQALFPGRKTWKSSPVGRRARSPVWRLSSRAQGGLLGCPSAGGVVGRRKPCKTLPPPKDGTLYLVGDGSVQTQAGDAESLGPKGTQKRASAVVFRHPLCPVDCHVGRRSLPRGLSPDSAQNPSGVPDGKCVVP